MNDSSLLAAVSRVNTLSLELTEAERSVVGSVLLQPDLLSEVEDVTPLDFLASGRAEIWQVILELRDKKVVPDMVAVRGALKIDDRSDDLKELGRSEELVRCTDVVGWPGNIRHFANVVKNHALVRKVVYASVRTITQTLRPNVKPEDLAEYGEMAMLEATRHVASGKQVTISQALLQAFAEIEGAPKKTISTGFVDADAMLGDGFSPGELTIVAARPSMGKTSLALGFARHAAEAGNPVLFFSLETAARDLAINLVAAEASVSAYKFRRRRLTNEEHAQVVRAGAKLAEWPLYLQDQSSISVAAIKSELRRAKAHGKLGLAIFDYLQLIDPGKLRKEANRNEELGVISRALKNAAMDLGVPIIALSQLSRATENRADKKPKLSDLRESGNIEQDADRVILLYRPDYYEPNNPQLEGKAEAIVAKQRNGPTGTIKLRFRKEFLRFDPDYESEI